MRTTLTLDDDVTARLARLQRKRKVSFKQIVNDAMRAGLDALEKPPMRKRFQTKGFNAGESLIGSLDDIDTVLRLVEGDDYK